MQEERKEKEKSLNEPLTLALSRKVEREEKELKTSSPLTGED
jgi:hypothetical protein